ncbi:MAG1140 family protein [Mycoplasma sp. CSL7503-lung]|uniref:MAG1140 family protein n=1 Tax=Mycoplasma sp. CSL7503-lung TaxID=536372 RepID=UPI0037C50866
MKKSLNFYKIEILLLVILIVLLSFLIYFGLFYKVRSYKNVIIYLNENNLELKNIQTNQLIYDKYNLVIFDGNNSIEYQIIISDISDNKIGIINEELKKYLIDKNNLFLNSLIELKTETLSQIIYDNVISIFLKK